ncbi:MAG TPA: CoA transferase [Trebonia sp.]|jgi:crotonobetainyl-CoA:carnitine CoA-transferase CaiB-like acyl-CoA transferase
MARYPLAEEFVVDLSSGIGGGYCTKILADGGADVVKIEAPDGDPLRPWSASGAPAGPGGDGALFVCLASSKRSVVVDPGSHVELSRMRELIRSAHGIVWSPGSALAERPEFSPAALHDLAPRATITAITPFGLTGPWAGQPATEATVQAWAGGAGQRGTLASAPLLVGGRIGDWGAGLVAGVAYLMSRHRRVRGGPGEIIDVSALESQCLTMIVHPVTWLEMAGYPMRDHRMANLPGIHPARDGFVGFMCVTGQQWLDFAAMVEQPGWVDDPSLLKFGVRTQRYDELCAAINGWTSVRTVAGIVELATLMRVPVAEVSNAASLLAAEHLTSRNWFVKNPRGGFLQPDVPYTLGGSAGRAPLGPAPRLGEHTGTVRAPGAGASAGGQKSGPAGRPFDGLRVADFTANWAGPIITHVLGMFGATVVKVESAARPDALRFNTVKSLDEDQYWEWSPIFHGTNTSKRGLTLDMSTGRGRELARRLVRTADVVVENSSPRVMDSWGLTAGVIRELNPACVYLRAPAYGLDGPWRDRVGYAQTIEMISGLAWLTGYPDGLPVIPNSPCDPVAGLHALVALMLALEHRRVTGEGMMVEVPMVGGALNFAAEQIVEWSAHGTLLGRAGNRSPAAAPQGCYRTADDGLPYDQGRYVVISCETDAHWRALRTALGQPGWAGAGLDTSAQRRAAHDEIDARLAAWCAARSADEIVAALWPAGVPVGKVMLGYEQGDVEQIRARGWFQTLDHPVAGRTVQSGFPAVFSAGPSPQELHTSPAPCLGQHNHEILAADLGCTEEEIASLLADRVIGTRPAGSTAW